MTKTANLGLPLVQPSQAQKHVTVNTALARLDAIAQLRVRSSVVATPPSLIEDGAGYLVPAGASGVWSGRAGQIAVFSNGGWEYLVPRSGWRAWDEALGAEQVFDGTAWVPEAMAVSAGGAAVLWKVVEIDHPIGVGPTSVAQNAVPSHSQVLGVTARVLEPISGAGVTSWRLGVAESDNRYGSGLGLGQGSYALGLSGSPVTYYQPTDIVLTAQGGAFDGGMVRLAVHLLQLIPPRMV